jgi:hypothetical protein
MMAFGLGEGWIPRVPLLGGKEKTIHW